MSESVTTLYLMRHGEVDEAYHRIFGGTIDIVSIASIAVR
jgi:hypothetical protein